MPKRKRRDKETAQASRPSVAQTATDPHGKTGQPERPAPAIDPAVALFAQRHREGIERDKQKQRDRAAQQHKVNEHTRLISAKDEAVANMKRINQASGSTQEDRNAADAAYRAATADVIADETGDRPDWAPAIEDLEGSTDAVIPDSGGAPDAPSEDQTDEGSPEELETSAD